MREAQQKDGTARLGNQKITAKALEVPPSREAVTFLCGHSVQWRRLKRGDV
jgi:hypothetical protein